MIKNISIHGLRGFGERETIDFALPNGEDGSGITFLVESNDSGKTTILEALRYLRESERNLQRRLNT